MAEATQEQRDVADLLIEVGTEELPPKALRGLGDAFAAGVGHGLVEADLRPEPDAGYETFASPRRLAVLVRDVAMKQPDRQVERHGPALKAAFDDDGCPTKAAEGFARSCGVAVEDLGQDDGKLHYRVNQTGRTAAEVIPGIVEQALADLPIPKRMRWGDGEAEFVRPVHWLVLLHGNDVVDAEILGARAGRETRGHRFHHPEPIHIARPADYPELLHTEGKVIAHFARRREAVEGYVADIAHQTGGEAVIDPDLLDEVTAMVEWPVAVCGSFDERFLDIPPEALISSMKGHQKYFHLVDTDGRLMPRFITVANIESRKPDKVREGNERVIGPRLADTEFFWEQDRRARLESRRDALGHIVFQQKLGTVRDKSDRVARVAAHIADTIGGDAGRAERAALLSKCDLVTEMVGEFPELQGTMGRYYAEHDGEPDEIARAQEEQYMPRFAGDELPATCAGQAVAVSDKLDTVVGIFGIGQHPSGNKDPFALRRAALGILRILIERGLDLDLQELIGQAVAAYESQLGADGLAHDTAASVFEFTLDRLQVYYRDRGIAHDVFDAVRSRVPTRPLDFDARVRAVTTFRELPEAESLAAANKRIANILKKTEEGIPEAVDRSLFAMEQETALADALDALRDEVEALFEARDYEAALKRLAHLREPVDAFFDHVMVMADDESVRRNRLALLDGMRNLFLRVADLSHLQ